MIKWAEVYTGTGKDRAQVAALIVSDDTDDGAQTMLDLKDIYGAEASYHWHYCLHDEGGGCRIERA